MAHVTRAIEVEGDAESIHQQWLRFEGHLRCRAHALTAGIRWKAEVLTFEPLGERTRVKLRVEYVPGAADGPLAWRLEALLQSFAAFRARETGAEAAVT